MTYVVSFPRSGHHGFIGFLDKVARIGDDYCEFYTCTKHNGQKICCPFGETHWQKKGYACGAGKSVIKCHDFNLGLPVLPNHKYVIQYRHPFYSIESWYKMETGKGKDMGEWEDFFHKKLEFWRKFIKKWVIDTKGMENVFLVPYDRLGEPEFIGQVCEFMDLPQADIGLLPPNYFASRRRLDPEDMFLSAEEVGIRDYLLMAGIMPEFHAY